MAQICVVGSINADLAVRVARHPLPGETLLGTGALITAGGKGANQAVAAANLGASVSMVGAVGRDSNAQPALEFLKRSGVDLSHVQEVEAPTGLALITVSEDAENTIVVVPGANATVDKQQVRKAEAAIAEADIVVLQGEIPVSGFAEAVRLATGRVMVNLAPVIDVPADVLLHADPLVANEHEAGLILGLYGVDASAAGQTEEDMALKLREVGFENVVITRGSRGAVVATAEGVTPIAPATVTAVDSTGAGDAFVGALAAQLAQGSSLIDASQHAARVGAFAATRQGAQTSYPTPADELPAVTHA
ncbi:ribokinase [Corynebacterium glaucum]|uniref:ribokinase n=1 Tax=Corynebacterium glaucum TaxID=187491 RepID=UPI002659050F|nr:ribokinase [Corynebacterium glaucum]